MTPTERQRIEKELYKYIDTFCGGRENHTPILIEQLLTLIASEQEKVKNQAVDDCLSKINKYPVGLTAAQYAEMTYKDLESLKTIS